MINKQKQTLPLILAVDDDRVMLMTLEAKLKEIGYRVITAINGTLACEAIKKFHIELDAILLDRMMPDMDGLQVVEWIKQQSDLTKPPIIMQTGANSPDQIQEGIDAGVFYYLIKPIQVKIFKSVVASAVKESQRKRALNNELGKHTSSFKLINDMVIKLKTLQEAENVACFIANCFPDSDIILPGIAELIINSVEHGNLAISYNDKSMLINNGNWREELERKGNLDEYKNKFVEVHFREEVDKYMMKITDQGEGFLWHKYLNLDPARALDSNGRGIAKANMIFSKLQYNQKGNQVMASLNKSETTSINW